MMYKRILLPLDGSQNAEKAVEHATSLAKMYQAELVLMRVIEPLTGQPGISIAAIEASEEFSSQLAREYLEGIAATIRDAIPQVHVVIDLGLPHEQIIEFAENNSVDLIIISSRGQSGLSRWLMGRVAERVIRGGRTPVLIIRAD